VNALSGPFVAIAAVLCAAGAAKLSSPATAARSLADVPHSAIRAFALAELAVGVWAAVHPTVAGAVAVAILYTLFAIVGARLSRRRLACGCFGSDGDIPASPVQVVLSSMAALAALAAAVSGAPHGAAWMVSSGPYGVVLLAAALGSAYAIVLCYTRLSSAWLAWSAS
jgi:hypothetical protein